MDLPSLIISIAVLAVGVPLIAYILLRKPKEAASVGSEGEISLGEEVIDEAGEETEIAEEPEAVEENVGETEENADA